MCYGDLLEDDSDACIAWVTYAPPDRNLSESESLSVMCVFAVPAPCVDDRIVITHCRLS